MAAPKANDFTPTTETLGMNRSPSRTAAFGLLAAGVAALALGTAAATAPDSTTLRFEATVAPGLLPKPTDGRLLVVIGRGGGRGGEPRNGIAGNVSLNHAPLLGADVAG